MKHDVSLNESRTCLLLLPRSNKQWSSWKTMGPALLILQSQFPGVVEELREFDLGIDLAII